MKRPTTNMGDVVWGETHIHIKRAVLGGQVLAFKTKRELNFFMIFGLGGGSLGGATSQRLTKEKKPP